MKYSFFLVLILSFACTTSYKETTKTLTKIDDVIFKVGYYPSQINHLELEDDNEIFGFLDYSTFKKLSVFNENGEFIYSISLKPLMQRSYKQFNSFSFQSIDTVAFLSASGGNVLMIMDSSENILLEKNYSFLQREKEASIYSPFIINNNVIRSAVNYDDTLPLIKVDEDYYRDFFSKKIYFYNIMTDTLFKKQSSPQLQADSLYSRFTSMEQWSTEGNKILFLDNKNIIYSAYSDSVYIYDLKGKLISVKQVYSNNRRIYASPISIEDDKSLTDLFRNSTYISYILWDKYRGIYYCFVPEKDSKDGKTPFSIIILDKDFSFISEVEMDFQKYYYDRFSYYPAFVSKKGLYIMNQSKSIKESKFSIFKYE